MIRSFRPVLLVSLFLTMSACASVPADLDLTLKHPTDHQAFVVELEPPATPPAVNKIHSWQIRVADSKGAPVRNARIAVDGGMPQHGHGFPTQPRVTREVGEGVYLLEGMKFNMTGWWEIRLRLDAQQESDTVTFNTVLGSSAH